MSLESDRSKSTFLARMSHEMRTPLNVIIGMCTIAQTANHSERIDNCLVKINEASIHLLGMINSVLDLAKIESGELSLTNAKIDLGEMLRRAVKTAMFGLASKGQILRVDIDPALPEAIIADEQRLTQVIENFFSNAVKFTPPEGIISLCVRKLKDDGKTCTLEISVSDTGIGIVKEKLDTIFSLFEQVDGGLTRKYNGAGLGLPVSAHIVRLMGGEIRVRSEPGKGSRFSFEITVEMKNKTAADEHPRPRFEGKAILLAEDVEINREIVIALLEDTGIVIDSAENGAEAFHKYIAAPEKYSLVLMDIHMPKMDGFEATEKIRAFEEELRLCREEKAGGEAPEETAPEDMRAPQDTFSDTRSFARPREKLPIIAMTANVFRDDVEKCLAAGMNGHLAKPVSYDDLMKQLDIYL